MTTIPSNDASIPEIRKALTDEIKTSLSSAEMLANGYPGGLPGMIGMAGQQVQEQPQQQQQQAPQPPPDIPIGPSAREQELAELIETMRKELDTTKAELRKASRRDAVEKAYAPDKLPPAFDSWPTEQQERWRMQQLMNLLEDRQAEGQSGQSGASSALEDKIETLELRQVYGSLSDEQLKALKELKRSRRPQTQRELLALAQINYPNLFVGQESAPAPSHQVMAPGRGAPPQVQSKDPVEDARQAMFQASTSRRATAEAGAAYLRQIAKTNPNLLFQGR